MQRSLKPRRDDTLLSGWESLPERAPSVVRADQPTVARFVAMIGLFLLVLGMLAMLLPRWGFRPVIGPFAGFFFASLGMSLLIFHAFADSEWQFRRLYSGLALLGIIGAVITRVLPSADGFGAYFTLLGTPALFLSLAFLIATVRHETDAGWRSVVLNIIATVAMSLLAVPLVVGLFASTGNVNNWLPGEGIVLLILGLMYISAYIGLQDTSSERGYYAGLVLGAIGLVAIVGGLLRTYLPESEFFVPSGLILMGMGVVFVVIALATCLDWPLIVLTRRELGSFFFSPVAYLVFAGQLIVGWFMFFGFVAQIVEPQGTLFEPIVSRYIFSLIPVIMQIFIVPALTMRLLSEEQRTGTLEVLLTAPVNEFTVVFSKFLAAWVFYLLLWIPWWLFLVSLRYFGGEAFDYRPILSFNLALIAISAGFIAMGLFFSSLTRNQIIAAVLTFVGMVAPLAAWIARGDMGIREGSTMFEVLTFASFLEAWLNSLDGVLAPRYLVFHLSLAVFFLYLTTQVLASRRWK